MNETEAFITQLCGRPRRCDFHCRGESNRDVVCVIIVMLSWKGAGWEN